MTRFAFVVLCLAGCVTAADVECPGGELCAAGTSCALSNGNALCIPNAKRLDDCDGYVALDECGTDRRCYDADIGLVCLPAFCGNGYTDPGEACDAGDNLTGDGCSADCRSTEVCGNAVVDAIRDERCDDGGIASHDGCSSDCNPELPQWSEAWMKPVRIRTRHGMAFDTRRGRAVVFGGTIANPGPTFAPVDETLEWTGREWALQRLVIAPPGRDGPAMTYDAKRAEVVMFGGSDSSDTWLWNGTRWMPLETIGPSARMNAAMVYDVARDTIVLFGGESVTGPSDETWELRGTIWTKLATATHPPAPAISTRAALVYDPGRGVVVAVSSGEAWELAGGQWKPIAAPPAVGVPYLAYDSIARRIILLGAEPTATSMGVWSYTGSGWTALPATSITPRASGSLVSDPVRGHLLFYGAISSGTPRDDSWEWDGTTWSRLVPLANDGYLEAGNLALVGAAMAHDPRHGLAIMFGGRGVGAGLTLAPPDTWAYNGVAWRRVATTGPAARYDHTLAADTEHDQIVLFGGIVVDAGGVARVNGETWLWDGTAWKPGPAGPPARRQAAMAYDPKRKRVVLFGGSIHTPKDLTTCNCLGDTWEWDGTAWSQNMQSPAPPPMAGARLAYDPVSGTLVMYAGSQLGMALGTTWIYDGTWRQLAPATSPPARAYGVFAFDPARRALVYHGGTPLLQALADAWEWVASANLWRRVPVSAGLQSRFAGAGATSPDGNGIVVAGGLFSGADSQGLSEPFVLRWNSGDREESCATRVDSDGDGAIGCADPDCWEVCTPLCSPGAVSCTSPRCGDGTCDPAFESRALCPADCGAPLLSCGDLVCDPGESCAADC